MRFRILLAVLLLSSLAFGAEWKKDYKVGASPVLQVEAKDGSLEVHSGSGSAISVVVTTRGWEIGPNDVRIIEQQAGDQVYLQVKTPSQHWVFNFGNHSIKVDVTVPQNTRVQLTTSDGSIKLNGTRAGAVLTTSDGSINVADFEGDLKARTSDGSIDVNGRFTGLNLTTSDGQITAEARTGSKISGSWSAQTSDGSIHLRLPGDLAFNLDAWTSDGGINSDLPVTVEGSQSQNRLRGKVNGGGPTFQVHTSDGSIHISRI